MTIIGLLPKMNHELYFVFLANIFFRVFQSKQPKLPQPDIFPLPLRVISTDKTKNMLLKLAHLSVIPLY